MATAPLHGLLKCQYQPFLTTLEQVKVIACHQVQPIINPKEKKTVQEQTPYYEIVLDQTILFAEGGGQPGDQGKLNEIEVVDSYRNATGQPVHKTYTPLEINSQVKITLNWSRRLDHMQQHTGQHLISAIMFSTYGWKTMAWSMAQYPLPSYIELETPAITEEQLQHMENMCNEIIAKAAPIRAHVYSSLDQYKAALEASGVSDRKKDKETNKTLVSSAVSANDEQATSDSASANSAASASDNHGASIRVIEIEGVDFNMCCGTHLATTAQLNVIKFLPYTTKNKNNTRISFVAGQRAVQQFDILQRVERSLNGLLRAPVDQFEPFVKKLQLETRDQSKAITNLNKELAVLLAEKAIASLGQSKVIFMHRPDTTPSFLSALADAITEVATAQKLPAVPAFLLCGTSEFLVRGPEALISAVGAQVAAALGAKAGGKKGSMQGKAAQAFTQAQLEEAHKALSSSA